MSEIFSKYQYRFIFILIILLYSVTAYNSLGFHHADEHYQIIEFANAKMGKSSFDDLPWEYEAKIRSTIQPTISYLIFSGLEAVSIKNPYTKTFVLRLLTGIFSLLVITFFVARTKHFFREPLIQKVYFFLSYFIWFLPFIAVRYSSEVWGGLFFLIGVALAMNDKDLKKNTTLIGVLAGLSFLFRFQMAFAILGFLCWAFFVKKERIRFYIRFFIGFLSILILGILIDFWFYQELVFTPFNYFTENIIENKSSNYGTFPWYFYILKLITYPTMIVGVPLVVGTILFFRKNRSSLITWVFLFFIFAHSIIPHKEERFLFPLVFFFPFILTSFYGGFLQQIRKKLLVKGFLILFCLVNIFLLLLVSQKATGRGRLKIAKFIYEHFKEEKVDLYLEKKSFIFSEPDSKLKMNYYQQKNVNLHFTQNFCTSIDSIGNKDRIQLVVIERGDVLKINCRNLVFLTESFPVKLEYLHYLDKAGLKIPKTDKVLLLYQYKPE